MSEKNSMPLAFIAMQVTQVTFKRPLPDGVLTAIWYMPGHVQTMQHSDKVVCTFKTEVYAEGSFTAALREVIAKAEGR
jgi:hypothetical protein